jgi:hypothetical protein
MAITQRCIMCINVDKPDAMLGLEKNEQALEQCDD